MYETVIHSRENAAVTRQEHRPYYCRRSGAFFGIVLLFLLSTASGWMGCAEGYSGTVEDLEEEEEELVPTSIEIVGVDETYRAGELVIAQCAVFDQHGEFMESAAGVEPKIVIEPDSLMEVKGKQYRAVFEGSGHVRCTLAEYGLISEDESFDIVASDPYRTIAQVQSPQMNAGEEVDTNCLAYDRYGNPIEDEDVLAELEVVAQPEMPGSGVDGTTFSTTTAELYSLTCNGVGVAQQEPDVVRVEPGLPYSINVGLRPDRQTFRVGDHTVLSTDVRDRFGNRVTGASIDYSMSSPDVSHQEARYSFNQDGIYTLSATVTSDIDDEVDEVKGSIQVLVDTSGPSVRCMTLDGSEGADALFLDGPIGGSQNIAVEVRDTFEVQSVQINGVTATPNGDDVWIAPISTQWGHNFIHVAATDEHDVENSQYCFALASANWRDDEEFFDDSVSLVLGQGALGPGSKEGSLSAILEMVLGTDALRDLIDEQLIAAGNFYNKRLIGKGYYVGDSLHFDSPEVRLTAEPGGLGLYLSIENFRGKLRHKTRIWRKTLELKIDEAEATAGIDLWTENGGLRADLHELDIELRKPRINMSGLAGKVVSLLVNIAMPLIKGLIEKEITKAAKKKLQEPIAELVTSLDIDTVLPEFTIPRIDADKRPPDDQDVTMQFSKRFSNVISYDHDRLIFGLGTRFVPQDVDIVRETLGVPIRTTDGLYDQSLQSNRPLALAVQETLLNQVLHALWQAGYFQIDMDIGDDGYANIDAKLPPLVRIEEDELVLEVGALSAEIGIPPFLDEPAFFVQLGARLTTSAYIDGTRLVVDSMDFDPAEDLALTLPDSISPAAREVLENVIGDILIHVLTITIDDALPDLPVPAFDVPEEFLDFLEPGSEGVISIDDPQLLFEDEHLLLRGALGVQ